MQRHQLEHIVRAAAGITGASEFVVVGSQAVLGQFPEAPDVLLDHSLTKVVSIVRTDPTPALVRKLMPLPAQVRNHLHQVAKKQARLGVRMFLFGSVARTWPQAHVGADLDIGYEIDGNRIDRADRLESLERDIQALPSIRPVDLVDFSKASEAFRAQALQHTVELADDSVATATE